VGDLATRARWFIDSASARNVKLTKLKSYSESDDSDAEHAHNTADDAPVGVIDKPGGGSLDFEYYNETGTSEVNWRTLRKRKEFFTLTKHLVGGARVQYTRCYVANVTSDGDDQGSHMQKIKILWAERQEQ